MEWYWYLVIGLVVFFILVCIALFANKRLKDIAYELVENAEKALGSGQGSEKYKLVLDNLSKLTKGFVPTSVLEKVIELSVEKLKLMLKEDKKSIKDSVSEKEEESK